MPQKWTWIPRELPGGRASFIHVFEPVEDGQTRGANVFYSVMEQMKMLDTLQKAPAMTPLMLDTSTRKLVVWDGTTDGAAVGILAVAADQTSTTLTFYKSGTFRYEDVLWPEAASDETKKRTAFAGTAISIV